jgi:hypothetical protein
MTQSRNKIVEILGVMAAAYPNFDLKEQTIQVYCKMLADLDPVLLEEAANMHIATGKFFPTIAELRGSVATLMERGFCIPSAMEAWGEVVEKMRKVGNFVDFGGGQPEFSNPLISRVVGYLDWNLLCLTDNMVADRARFIQAYEVELNRAREDMKFLPETHDTIQRLQAASINTGIKQLTEKLRVK